MKLVVSLDLPSKRENLELLDRLKGLPAVREGKIWAKIGFRSFIRDGKGFVEEVKKRGFPVFLDLKIYDIPNTMADSAEEIAKMGVEMFNIHLSAGKMGVAKVMERLSKFPTRPKVLGVTILTSFTPHEVLEIYGSPVKKKALQLAQMGYRMGIDGVVCSVWESGVIKEATSPDFITLTPGIRLPQHSTDDQSRVATPAEAAQMGVDFIVMGRPIYRAENPVEVVNQILPYLN